MVAGILLFLGAWTGFGMGVVLPWAADRFAPAGWTIELGEIEGSWLSRIQVDGLSMTGPGMSLEARQLAVDYSLAPLLDKKVAVEALELDRPTATITIPDTAASETAEPEGSGLLRTLLSGDRVSSWDVEVGSFRIVDGHAQASAADQWSYTLAGLELAASASLEQGLSLQLDTLGADFVSVVPTTADSTFTSAGKLALAARLSEGTLQLDTLVVESEHSHVSGGGRVAFVDRQELWSQANLEVVARPLDLRDLPAQLPEPLSRQPEVTVSVTASGDPDSLVVSLDLTAMGGSTVSRGRAVLRGMESREQGRPALDGSLTVDGVDLSLWSSPPFDGAVDGQADFTLSDFASAARFTARGSARHAPRTVDEARLWTRPLEVRFDVDGALPGDSTTGTSLRADARLDVAVDRPGRRIGVLAAEVEGAAAAWTADLRLGEGALQGRGSAEWSETSVGAVVETLQVAQLDLAVVDTMYPVTRLTGAAQGRMRRGQNSDLQGMVEVQLSDSRVREFTVDSVSLRSRIRGMTFDGALLARSDLGAVQTRYRVELEDSLLRFQVDSLAYSRPDTADSTEPLAEVYGRASGSWRLGERREGSLEASVDSARWAATSVAEAEVSARLRGEDVRGDVSATVGGVLQTPVQLRARAELAGVMPEGDGSGTPLSGATGTASVTASRPHGEADARSDTLYLYIVADEPGRYRLDGSARPAEGGRLDFDGSARAFLDSLSFDVEARGALDRSMAILGGADIDSLEVVASGRRISGVWEGLRGDVRVWEARWRELVAENALASVRFDSTGVLVDTLDVRSNVFQAFGRGRLPSQGGGGRIEVRAEVLDLEPVRELAGLEVLASGDGVLEASASGSLDSLSWSGELDLEALVVNRTRFTGVRFTGDGVVAAPYDFLFGLSSTDMELTLDRILLPQSEVRTVSVTAAGGSDSLRVAANAIADDRRNASVLVHVDPRPDRRTARIEDLRFQIDQDEWRLAEEALLRYGAGISVEPVLLRAGDQEIRMHGGISETGELDLNARMDSTDVGTVADLAGLPRLRGWLSGRVRIQGTTAAPEAWLDVAGAFHRDNRRPGPVEVQLRANGRRVRGSLELLDANRGLLSLAGGGLLPGAEPRGDVAAGGGNGTVTAASAAGTVFGLTTDSVDVSLSAETFDLR
ncbi:MAG: hypothetical protein R3253_00230, partial [Longimicrobiales bacterium]|nr:hypothetical protein [Longimicrobiales bacterium]